MRLNVIHRAMYIPAHPPPHQPSQDATTEPAPPALPLRLYCISDSPEIRQLDSLVEDLVRQFAKSVPGGVFQFRKAKDSFGTLASVKTLVSELMSERFGATIVKLDRALGVPGDKEDVDRKRQALTAAMKGSVFNAIGKLSDGEMRVLKRRLGHHDDLVTAMNAKEAGQATDWVLASDARAAFIDALQHLGL
ncbi:hypothetical protein ABE85_23120 [Mitsuaria sp. 7]|nr:hypothetical protein ABE85_23120 [Mitsuaria sp. 7]